VDKCPNFVTELRKLTELTVLKIHFDEMEKSAFKALMESLRNMHKIQCLWIYSEPDESVFVGSWEDWVPSSNLCELALYDICLSRLPSCICFSRYPHLSYLAIQVEVVEARDLQILGRLPLLRHLVLMNQNEDCPPYTVGSDEFPSLRFFRVFMEILCGGEGALPLLEELICNATVGMPVGLVTGNMPLLQIITYYLDCTNCSCEEVEQAEAALRLVANTHPNRPTLEIERENYESDDDDGSEEVSSADEEESFEDQEGGSKEEVLENDHESDNDGTEKISHVAVNEAATTSKP